MQDQADELRQLVRENAHQEAPGQGLRSLVVVSGGRPGVGTTTVAVNLAATLASLGSKTMFLDADFQRADATVLCGVSPQRSLTDVLSARAKASDIMFRHESGLQVMPADWSSDGPPTPTATTRRRLMSVLSELDRQTDFLVVDAGNQCTAVTKELWQAAAQVLVVTTTENETIMGTYASIKDHSSRSESTKVSTLINRANDGLLAEEVVDRLEQSARRFLNQTIFSAGHLHDSPALAVQAKNCQIGTALHDSEARSFFSRLCMTIQMNRLRAEAPSTSIPASITQPTSRFPTEASIG